MVRTWLGAPGKITYNTEMPGSLARKLGPASRRDPRAFWKHFRFHGCWHQARQSTDRRNMFPQPGFQNGAISATLPMVLTPLAHGWPGILMLWASSKRGADSGTLAPPGVRSSASLGGWEGL